MPFVTVSIARGRPPEQVRALISALTDAVVDSLGADKQSVRVIVTDVSPTHWAAGDITLAERANRSG
ncbi:MAG: 4-oxalocrotonate tautomerase [Propionibacteriales bacterium]|nr:4-oxalocrotonate tautomerase [Propionibacteriales bacterium]